MLCDTDDMYYLIVFALQPMGWVFEKREPAEIISTQWHLLKGLEKKPFKNILGKGEVACTSNFSFSHNIFYSIKDRNYQFWDI